MLMQQLPNIRTVCACAMHNLSSFLVVHLLILVRRVGEVTYGPRSPQARLVVVGERINMKYCT